MAIFKMSPTTNQSKNQNLQFIKFIVMELTKQHNILQPTIHFEYVEDFSKHLIDKMIHGAKLTEDGKVYSDSTIRQYKSFLRYFIEFRLE